jgi:hypothetical protein
VPRNLLNIDNNSGHGGLPLAVITPFYLMRFDDYPYEKNMDVLEIVLESL